MKKIPEHIAIIPDGNRRWAKQKKLPTLKGHQKGYQNFLDFCDWAKKRGVKTVTGFGFSTENWNRNPKEINYLMKLFEFGIRKQLKKNGKTKIKIIGRKNNFSQSLREAIEKIEEATKNNNDFQVNIGLDYGGRWDILQSFKKMIESKSEVKEDILEKNLSTTSPDLLIRAGGEKRLSNFIIWQLAYSEIYFSDKLWPAFSEKDLDKALEDYSNRQRRFGK